MQKAPMYSPAYHNHSQHNRRVPPPHPPLLQSTGPQEAGRIREGKAGIFSKVRRTTSIRALLPWLLWKAKSGVQKGQAREAQSRRERVKGQGCGKVKWFPPSNLTRTVNHFRKPTGLQCKTSILKLKKKKQGEQKKVERS